MSANPYNTKEFRELEAEWDEKLRAEGLENIESAINKTRLLKVWHDHRFERIPWLQIANTGTYFRWASKLLLTYPFKNETQRKIWELHCEGKSKRQIVEAIKNFPKTYRREQVGNIINKIKEAMK